MVSVFHNFHVQNAMMDSFWLPWIQVELEVVNNVILHVTHVQAHQHFVHLVQLDLFCKDQNVFRLTEFLWSLSFKPMLITLFNLWKIS